MPARDAYHTNLINALVKDNWSITEPNASGRELVINYSLFQSEFADDRIKEFQINTFNYIEQRFRENF